MAKISIDDIQLKESAGLQQQLYQQLSQRIIEQRYPPGSQLPSSRELAADLKVSRNTIIAVYDQLKAEGFIEALVGKGVYINRQIAITTPVFSPASKAHLKGYQTLWRPPLPLGNLSSSSLDNSLPFTPGLPDLAAFPIKSWNRVLHHQESLRYHRGYDNPLGYLPLRKSLATYLRTSRGLRCCAEQIIITNGAQQALSLIADVFLQTNDTLLIEDPGYRGARYALGRHANLEATPLLEQVLDVQALQIKTHAKLLYCTPTHQYPLGGVLDISQRISLLNWALSSNTWIIEDDYDSEFHFYTKPFASLQGMFETTPVLYIGSFSKTLFPATRVGYLVVPEDLLEHFIWAKRITSGESPLLMQAVIAEFMESGQFTRHVRRMRQIYREKWEQFHRLVLRELDGYMVPIAESAGMHLVLQGGINDTHLSQQLYQRGFGSAPLSAHFIQQPSQQGLVLGFASANEQQMLHCIKQLQKCAK